MNIPPHESHVTSQLFNYPVSETGEPSQYSISESGERTPSQYPVFDSEPTNGDASTPILPRELRKQRKRNLAEKAETSQITTADEADFKEAVEDWFANKRPQQFPTILFKVLGKLDDERKGWLQANPDVGSEIMVEAWHSPKPNEYPLYRNISGVRLWKWLSQPVQDKFTLISLSGLTLDILKALLIHYEIKIQTLYEMIFIDSFCAAIQPPSENVFALCFDFLRLVPLGNERHYHTQAFPEFENQRRSHILTWKWNPFGSEPESGDRAFEIARTVIWIQRDTETGKMVAVFFVEPKKCKKINHKSQAQWRMSQFCDDVRSRTRSTQFLPELENEVPSEKIFHFLERYFREAFRCNRVLGLHQQRISALEEEAFTMPMIETTRDIYRQKAALDIHLTILHLQKTMISALRNRQVSDKMFWPKDGILLFGDLEDALGEKIIDLERMRKQCDDIQNLIFNTIAIEESRAAVDQGRSVGRLTWLTFVFLPLSFGASILGMNVFQLNSPGLWLYFALTVPLLLLITGCILLLKAGVLYSQSGQSNLGFARWLFSGRPMRSRIDRADLERGNLTVKLKDRLRGPLWEGETRGPIKNKKED